MSSDPSQGEAAQALFCALADYVGDGDIDKVLNIEKYKTLSEFENTKKLYKGKSGSQLLDIAWKECRMPGLSLSKVKTFLNTKSGKKSSGWYESSVIIAKK